MRIINFESFRSHTNELFKKAEMLKLNDIIKMEYLKIAFEYKRGNLPNNLNNLFLDCDAVHNHLTRSKSNNALFVQRFNSSKFGRNSLRYKATTLWNELSNSSFDISSCCHIWNFKKKYKKHLLYSY